MPALQTELDAFDRVLRDERQLSAHTRAAYQRDLGRLQAFLITQSVEDWGQVGVAQIRQWVAAEHRRGLSAASLQRALSAVRSFYAHLIRHGQASADPAADVQAPKRGRPLPKSLDVDEVSSLLESEPASVVAVRDQAMMELIYSSGLRLAELVGINLNDFRPDEGLLRVTGKGAKAREVPVGRMAARAVRRWVKLRGEIAAPDEPALFVSTRGGRLSPRSVQSRLAQAAERAGLPSRLHPHRLRHAFATHMLESSGDLRAVQELLGHASISTTQVYTHLDFQHLADVYDKAHPRARRSGGAETPED
ncbi:MAG: tyrosine recombinase XerC [Nevskiales bacterium]|nr:tyrosine recombinase XerC [Nevskiales bacterium]